MGGFPDGMKRQLLTNSAVHVPLDQLVLFSCEKVLPDLPATSHLRASVLPEYWLELVCISTV